MKIFETLFLTPSQFKNALKGVFDINLSRTELGSLVDRYDDNGNRLIVSADFVVSFIRLGIELRAEARSASIER